MAVRFTGFGGVQTSQDQQTPTAPYTPVAPATGTRIRKPMAADQGGAEIRNMGNGVIGTSGGAAQVVPDPVNSAHINYNNGGMSDGVLGYLGIKPENYASARELFANQPQTYSNDGFAGVQNHPANAPLNAQMAAQRPGLLGSPGTPGMGTQPNNMNSRPGGPAMGGTSGGMFQDVNVNNYSQNPYLAQMGQVLTNRVTDNLNRNIMPGIRSNAVMAGGFGGSRQGVVEANAMKDANQTISDALTGTYFQDFTNQMNRNLQQYGQNQGFYSNQRGQDLQSTALGADLFERGNQGFLSQGAGMYGLGGQQQKAPWEVVNNANAGLGQWSGYGTTTSANQGGGAQGALGGALGGAQFGSLFNRSPNAAGGVNSSGFGTGSGFGNQDFGQFF